MKIGDKVRMRPARPGAPLDEKVGIIVELTEECVSIQYPGIGGTFTFKRASAVLVDDE